MVGLERSEHITKMRAAMAGYRAETAELIPMPNDAHINVVRLRVGIAGSRRGPAPERDVERGSVIPFPVRIAFGSVGVKHGGGTVITSAHDRPRRESGLADADDYRRRMLVNLLTLAVVLVLVVTGSWAFGTIAKTAGSPHLLTSLASPVKLAWNHDLWRHLDA
jgi:hypothetical protein